MFGTTLICICTVMHLYVLWRAASVPFLRRHVPRKHLVIAALVLWVIFVLGREYGHGGSGAPAMIVEWLGMNWMAALFLIFVALLAADLVTAFGFLLPRWAPSIRGWALVLGVTLSIVALVQGLRPPVVERYEVHLPGLPEALDGTVIVGLSDLHLGSQIGEPWLAARILQVQAEQPDLVVLLGDLFEGHGLSPQDLLGTFARLSPPLGVWCVPGNHEARSSMPLMEEAGYVVLRNEWRELKPGLVMAGVDAGRRSGEEKISRALADRPAGAAILLAHRPRHVETAAGAGADLMLCGHTHGGQVWPFGYLVRFSTPWVEGRYDVDGTTVIVSRGAGTWGPRMRLWPPGEILHITLRVARETAPGPR